MPTTEVKKKVGVSKVYNRTSPGCLDPDAPSLKSYLVRPEMTLGKSQLEAVLY